MGIANPKLQQIHIYTHTQKQLKHNSNHRRENKRGREGKRPAKTNPEQLRKRQQELNLPLKAIP